MPRYIDADALVENLQKYAADEWNKAAAPASWSDAYDSFVDYVSDFSTSDVEPVRHGRWIDKNGDYVCSVCGWAFSGELPYMARKRDAKTEEIMRYCMHCGAKFDGGEDNAEQQAETDNNSETG